jgi:UDP-glucose 4-epimerase
MLTVIVTGIAGRLARLVAGVLASQPHVHVVGLGRTLPESLDGVELATCDFHGAALRELFHHHTPDVVLHLDQPDEEHPSVPRDAGSRGSVYRAIELLGAAAATGVGRVVLRSSTLVYGARRDAPVFLDEQAPLVATPHANLTHDYAEIERIAADFARRHPALAVIRLRCAGIVGNGFPSPLARYLSQDTPRTLLGFDPRIQVLHPHDAAVAFALAALSPAAGPFNIASERPVTLSHAIRLAGRQPLPLPAPAFATAALVREGRLGGLATFAATLAARATALIGPLPFDSAYFRYACVADTRRARAELGWMPQHTVAEVLREFGAAPH